MINHFRALSARLITRYLRRPRVLVTRAWFWLAAQTDDLNEKRRCLEATLELDRDNKSALGALQWVLYQQQAVHSMHPTNAEELANITREYDPNRAQSGRTPPDSGRLVRRGRVGITHGWKAMSRWK